MPPTTAYWINSTDPNTLYCVELHVRLTHRKQHTAERGDRRRDCERVHLRRDDVDPERRGGALVAAHGEQPRARLARAAGSRRADRRSRGRRARTRRSAAGGRSGRGRCPRTTRDRSAGPRTPPVTALFVKINALNISAIASVATARLVPRVRIAGRATTTPTKVVPTTAASIAAAKVQPSADTRRAAIHAPNPANANWHNDSCPAYPATTTTEHRMIPIANVVMSASAHVSTPASSAARHDDTDHEREQRNPSACRAAEGAPPSRHAGDATGR